MLQHFFRLAHLQTKQLRACCVVLISSKAHLSNWAFGESAEVVLSDPESELTSPFNRHVKRPALLT